MPTILRVGKFRFHFYSNEGDEPAHIHIRTPEGECKYWLDPVELATNKGIPVKGLRYIERMVFKNHAFLKEKYHEFHGF